jgi:hypothetical protein
LCGPTSAQQRLAGSEEQFGNILQSNYAQNFANNQAILGHLNSVLAPIVAKGPDQTGFSPEERAAFNTQAINTTGAASANARRAIANETAGRNDSGNLGEAGNVAALEAGASSAGASQLASEQLGITEADYATGRSNFNNAVSAENAVAGGYSPLGYAGAATKANETAFGEATQIAQEQAQEQQDIASGITSLATGGLSGFASSLGSSAGGGSPVSGVDLGGFADLGAF